MTETTDLNYNLPTILDTMGLVQGITLGVLLLILNYRHFRNTYFLGLFLLLFSLKLAVFVSIRSNLDQIYPELFLLPLDFSWLLFPLFFIYTQKISIFSDQKIKYWILYPGILSFVLQVIIYFLPYSTKVVVAQSFWHELVFTILGICYSWVIGIWNLKLIAQHKTEVRNTFSHIDHKILGWVQIFLIYSLLSSFLIHILYYISPDNYYFKIIFSTFDLIAIYWVSVNGVIQQNVLSILAKNESGYPIQNYLARENDLRKNVIDQDLSTVMEVVDSYMKTTEAFLVSELTIIDLADKLKIHPKKISGSINSTINQNFNSYVNQLRIKKAEDLLNDKSLNHFSIEGISKEVGFHSKSAFYAAFKKFTGTTPNKYKENISV